MSNTEDTSPTAGSITPAPAPDATGPKSGEASRPATGKALVGAAVGIGSAAIVAALLYARKRS